MLLQRTTDYGQLTNGLRCPLSVVGLVNSPASLDKCAALAILCQLSFVFSQSTSTLDKCPNATQTKNTRYLCPCNGQRTMDNGQRTNIVLFATDNKQRTKCPSFTIPQQDALPNRPSATIRQGLELSSRLITGIIIGIITEIILRAILNITINGWQKVSIPFISGSTFVL